MEQINSPFSEQTFPKNTKILLDACIVLALMDKSDKYYTKCSNILDKLCKDGVIFYTSNVVLSEVLNKTLNNLFARDLQNIICVNNIVNNGEDFKTITKRIKDKDLTILLNEKSTRWELWGINYGEYFKDINKNKNADIRNSLRIYFEMADKMCKRIEEKYDLKFLPINENIMKTARDFSTEHMLCINDSQHLSTAKTHRMDFILSTDGDFSFVEEELKVKFLKVC